MTAPSRKTATLLNLIFQYLMMALMIIRGIILPPLAARFIDHDLLGAWLASGNIVQWLMISEGGAWLYLRQRTAIEFGRGDRKALSEVIGSGAMFLFLLGALIILLGLAIAPWVPGWLHVADQFSWELSTAFMLTIVGMGLSVPAVIPRAIGHGLQKQIAVNVSLLISELISVAASIALLFSGYGVLALGAGPLIREVAHNFFNWPILASMLHSVHIRPSISRAYFKNMTGQMGWTFVNNFSGVLRRNVDALIVSLVFGNSTVLAVEWTKRAWEIFSSLITRASSSFTPALAHLYGEGDLPKFRRIGARLFVVTAITLGVALGMGLALNAPFVDLWIGAQFYVGADYNLLLGLATVASAIGFTLLEVLFATGNIRRPAIAQLVQTIARIGILFALVPLVGILCIPLSLLITEVLGGVVYLALEWQRTLKVSRREIFIQFLIIARALVTAVVIAKVWEWLPRADTWTLLFMHGALFGVSIALAFYLVEPFVRIKVNNIFLSFWQHVVVRR